jgi:hypothetical protein
MVNTRGCWVEITRKRQVQYLSVTRLNARFTKFPILPFRPNLVGDAKAIDSDVVLYVYSFSRLSSEGRESFFPRLLAERQQKLFMPASALKRFHAKI